MTTIFHDYEGSEAKRRSHLYAGDIFVYSPRNSTLALVEHTRSMVRQAFGSRNPELAQHEMPVEEYAALLGELKPKFIHDPESARLLRGMLSEFGCDHETYYDVPRMRTSTSDGYLTTGIALAWHPHRDTWYSAPACQINWWLPIWPVQDDNVMCFYPAHFARAVPNDSHRYNYYKHNAKHRGAHVARMVTTDTRAMPRPTEPVDDSSELRVVSPVGSVMLFSGGHLHASVPNTSGVTRFSVDFRTLHCGDARAKRGAPAVDVACGGSAIRDYRSPVDGAMLPEEIIALYHDADVDGGAVIYGE